MSYVSVKLPRYKLFDVENTAPLLRQSLIFSIWLSSFFISISTVQASADRYKLSIGAHVIYAELAMTKTSRTQGLMHRRQLCENCGMLFIFPSEKKWSFWSKNTSLALSVAFIDKNGGIIDISNMEPGSLVVHTSPNNVACALEMPSGWFSNNYIKIGDKLLAHFDGRTKFGKLVQAKCG